MKSAKEVSLDLLSGNRPATYTNLFEKIEKLIDKNATLLVMNKGKYDGQVTYTPTAEEEPWLNLLQDELKSYGWKIEVRWGGFMQEESWWVLKAL